MLQNRICQKIFNASMVKKVISVRFALKGDRNLTLDLAIHYFAPPPAGGLVPHVIYTYIIRYIM